MSRVTYRIVSKIPAKFDQIQQAIFQMDWKNVDLKTLNKKFVKEDARQQANRELAKGKSNQTEEAWLAQQKKEKEKVKLYI